MAVKLLLAYQQSKMGRRLEEFESKTSMELDPPQQKERVKLTNKSV